MTTLRPSTDFGDLLNVWHKAVGPAYYALKKA